MADLARISSRDLATKTVQGTMYSIGASAITLVMGFARAIIMARLLAPEEFGQVAFALTFLNFTISIRDWGLDYALIHHRIDDEETRDKVLSVHFALRLAATGLFVIILLGITPLLRYFYPQKSLLVPILWGLMIGEVANTLGATQTTYLRKEMRFKERAALQVLTSLTMTMVGPLMAWRGWGVWAIVGEHISGVIAVTVVVWLFMRPWQARWKFDWNLAKWYLNYGKFVFVSQTIEPITDQFDEFWIGTVLGSLPLGFYAKAYEFAHYPSRVVSAPIGETLISTFAKAQDDKTLLSKAYYRASSLIVRFGFLIIGGLMLAAHEFVLIFLGAKWLPMVLTFRLMVVYTLILPLLSTTSKLLNAVGHPEYGTQMKIVQVIFFIPAVIITCQWWGVAGVAIAVDLMLLIGLLILVDKIRTVVSVSFQRMLLIPCIALVCGCLGTWAIAAALPVGDLARMVIKTGCYSGIYAGLLIIFEHKDYQQHLGILLRVLRTPR